MQITSGKFEADLFAMTNSTDFQTNASYQVVKTEHLNPDANEKITLSETPVANTVFVRGLTLKAATATLATGEYKPDSTDSTGKTYVFYPGDVEGDVEITYEFVKSAQEALIDNRKSAIGEAILVYPVYSSADECAVDSAINGYVIMRVFRARVTSQPGLDGSYKSALSMRAA